MSQGHIPKMDDPDLYLKVTEVKNMAIFEKFTENQWMQPE